MIKRSTACALAVLAALACGRTTPVIESGAVPVHGHVFIVVEENANYASVIGSAAMPYLNGLAAQYGLATQYYANTHPSIGNYFMMTVGDTVTNNDASTATVPAAVATPRPPRKRRKTGKT